MQAHEANVSWYRDGAEFTDQRYSRAHEWSFDGGSRIAASASPGNVPEPCSLPAAVDPEEALVAAASSCHMLWFLAIAAKRGYVVDSYVDAAYGVIEELPGGKRGFGRITLRPRIRFSGETSPTEEELASMHREAHDECFIANSLRCDVVVAA